MNMMLLIALGCALIAFLLIMGIVALVRSGRDEADEKVKTRLRQFALTEVETESIDLILKQASMSEVPWFNRLLGKLSFAGNLNKTIRQADTTGSAGVYLLFCALLGIIGLYLGAIFMDRIWLGAILAGFFGYAPIWHLNRLKNKRMDKFQKQLPDALDLMSRALKAGHTFTGGMRMIADEFDNPIGDEFRLTLEEINFGVDVDRALANLQDR